MNWARAEYNAPRAARLKPPRTCRCAWRATASSSGERAGRRDKGAAPPWRAFDGKVRGASPAFAAARPPNTGRTAGCVRSRGPDDGPGCERMIVAGRRLSRSSPLSPPDCGRGAWARDAGAVAAFVPSPGGGKSEGPLMAAALGCDRATRGANCWGRVTDSGTPSSDEGNGRGMAGNRWTCNSMGCEVASTSLEFDPGAINEGSAQGRSVELAGRRESIGLSSVTDSLGMRGMASQPASSSELHSGLVNRTSRLLVRRSIFPSVSLWLDFAHFRHAASPPSDAPKLSDRPSSEAALSKIALLELLGAMRRVTVVTGRPARATRPPKSAQTAQPAPTASKFAPNCGYQKPDKIRWTLTSRWLASPALPSNGYALKPASRSRVTKLNGPCVQ